MREFFTVLSVVLVLSAGPPYLLDTLRHKTKPERATWLIFSVLGVIAFWGQLRLGGTLSLIFSGLDTLGSILVLALSIKLGVAGFTRLDKLALLIALVGLGVAVAAHQPVIAVLGVIVADGAGTVLTIRKVYLQPGTETTISWLMFATASVCALFTVGSFDVGLLLYPAYLALANYMVPFAQFLGARRQARAASQ